MGSRLLLLSMPLPEVDTPDYLVEQLAEAARHSRRSSARRGRFMVAVATATGAVLLSVGGAWATGAVDVPGLPDINIHPPQQPTPTEPDEPSPSPTPAVISPPAPPVRLGPSFSPGADPRGGGEHPPRRNKGEASGKRDNPAKQSNPGRGSPGEGEDNRGQQKDRGRSQSPGRSELATQGAEKPQADSSQAPDLTSGTSRGEHLGSRDTGSRGRG